MISGTSNERPRTDKGYLHFAPEIQTRGDLKTAVATSPSVQTQEQRLHAAFAEWWAAHEPVLVNLAQGDNGAGITAVRRELLESFREAFEINDAGAPTRRPDAAVPGTGLQDLEEKSLSNPVPGTSNERPDTLMLNRHQIDGVIAGWWHDNLYDLKTLAAQGFPGLVQSWIVSIRAALDGKETERDLLGRPLITALLPDYTAALAGLADQIGDRQAQIEAAGADDEEEDEPEAGLSPAQIKALQKEVRALKKERKGLETELLPRLETAGAALHDAACRALVLDIFRRALADELEGYVSEQRQAVVAALENWWDKYHVSLQDIESKRDRLTIQLNQTVQEIGYAYN